MNSQTLRDRMLRLILRIKTISSLFKTFLSLAGPSWTTPSPTQVGQDVKSDPTPKSNWTPQHRSTRKLLEKT